MLSDPITADWLAGEGWGVDGSPLSGRYRLHRGKWAFIVRKRPNRGGWRVYAWSEGDTPDADESASLVVQTRGGLLNVLMLLAHTGEGGADA